LVIGLDDLKRGDHIKWKRREGLDHHAIVESIGENRHGERVVNVIHYHAGSYEYLKSVVKYHLKKSKRIEKPSVKITELRHSDWSEMYKYIYDRWYDANEVVQRAISRLGERAYNMFTNNCEHFATWCKTGTHWSYQVDSFKLRSCVAAVEKGCVAIGDTVKCAISAVKNGSKIATEAIDMVASGIKAVSSGAGEYKKYALNSLCNVGVLGGVIAGITEVGLFGYNWHKAQKEYKAALEHAEDERKKESFKQQRNRIITEAACEGTGGLIGSTAGAVALSFIPVVGTVIGGVVGGFLGRWFGKMFGRFLGKKLF